MTEGAMPVIGAIEIMSCLKLKSFQHRMTNLNQFQCMLELFDTILNDLEVYEFSVYPAFIA